MASIFNATISIPEPQQDISDKDAEQNPGSHTVVVRHAEQMFSAISTLWETKEHSDVTLVAGCTEIAAHKIILASQSAYFDRLLFGSMMEAKQDTITIEGVGNIDAFLLLLKYAYSGSLEIHDESLQVVLEVLALSDRFGFVLLKNSIGSYLSTKLSATNANDLLVYSDLYNIEELHTECLAFFDKNAVEILQSDVLLPLPKLSLTSIVSRDSFYAPESSIFEAVVRWKEHNEADKDAISDVLHCIRLSEISPEDIFQVVEPHQLFSESEILNAVRVQVKQEIQHMQPRGRRVPSKNLFEHAAKLDQSIQYFGLPTGAPPTSITMGTVHLGAKHNTHVIPPSFPSGARKHAMVTLEDTFLVNYIEVEGIPTARSAATGHNNCFSFELMISKDKKDWLKLVDYSMYNCYGIQKLMFPTVAFKFLRFQLSSENSCSIKFVCCEFREVCVLPQLRAGGVIAPLAPTFRPLLLQHESRRPNSTVQVLVVFNQPYSISQLRFKVSGPPSQETEISVSVSSVYQESAFKSVATSNSCIPSSLLTINFEKEEVVSYIVVIMKIATSTAKIESVVLSKSTPEQSARSYIVTDLSCQATAQT